MGSDLEDLDTRLDEADIEVSTYVPQSALEEIAQATKSDAMLRDITEFIVHGWPETDAGLPEDLHLYLSLRDELAYHVGFVVKGSRVNVPEALREAILQRLHSPSGNVKNESTCSRENLLALDAWNHGILCIKVQGMQGGRSKVQPY